MTCLLLKLLSFLYKFLVRPPPLIESREKIDQRVLRSERAAHRRWLRRGRAVVGKLGDKEWWDRLVRVRNVETDSIYVIYNS